MERNEMKICSLRNENPLENADFKFSVNNEGEDVNRKQRTQQKEHRLAQRRQRRQ